ncbi:MAG: hypothetical protein ACRDWE_08780 [Acidimicrobiales bacterium]
MRSLPKCIGLPPDGCWVMSSVVDKESLYLARHLHSTVTGRTINEVDDFQIGGAFSVSGLDHRPPRA